MKTCVCKTKKPKRGVLGAIVSAIVLVLLPKCPMCIVGYAAIVGVGLSITAAALLREAVLFTCLLVLGFVSARVGAVLIASFDDE